MNKSEAIYQFWNSFGVEAYDENSVPDDAPFPYITYAEVDGEMFVETASIWDKSKSWKRVTAIRDMIAKKLGEYDSYLVRFDGGYYMLYQGTPFSQRMDDEDQTIKRLVLNVGGQRLARY